jgi:DNA-binding transcriptional LysR family regulator
MDLNAVAIFIGVIECRSFSKASEKTGVSTSSISRKVSELEASLNIQLIERTTRTLRLTEAGRIFYEKILPAVHAIESARLETLDNKQEVRGSLRISVPIGLEQSLIIPLLADFQKQYPEICLKVLASSTNLKFVEDGIDVALRVGELKNSQTIAHTLLEYSHILVASPKYLEHNSVPTHPAELSNHKIICATNWHDDNQWHFVNKKTSFTLDLRESLSLNHYAAIQLAVEKHMGIAELPAVNCIEAIKHNRLIRIMPDWRLSVFEQDILKLSIIYTANRYNSQIIKNFKIFCIKHFKEKYAKEQIKN